MHGPRRDDRQPALGGESGEHVIVHGVERPAVIEKLDGDVGCSEPVDQRVELGARRGDVGVRRPRAGDAIRGRTVVTRARRGATLERRAHGAFAAPGEDHPVVAARVLGEHVEVIDRAALLSPRELRVGDRGGEAVVTRLPAREHEQVRAFGVGHALLRASEVERKLGTEHGRDAIGLGRFGHTHDTVETVVVGHRKPAEPQPRGLFEQLFGARSAVEKAETGVRVQLGVRHDCRGVGLLDASTLVRPALVRPRGGVACITTERRARAGAAALAQVAFELAPRNRRVVPASHQRGPPLYFSCTLGRTRVQFSVRRPE